MGKRVSHLPSNVQIVKILISSAVRAKLESKHQVKAEWIALCFKNRQRKFMTEYRAAHKSFPETRWFIAEYEPGKPLKVCFVYLPAKMAVAVKTAYRPCEKEVEIYAKVPLAV